MQAPQLFYKERIEKLRHERTNCSITIARISFLRLTIALVTAGSVYSAFVFSPHLLWLTAGFIFLFLNLIQRHSILFGQLNILDRMIQLNRDEVAYFQNDKTVFDPGLEINTDGHLYAADLDIFGTGSIFRAINRTCTHQGRQLIIDNLLKLQMSPADIISRRNAIPDLVNETEWRQRFSAIGSQSGEAPTDMKRLSQWLEERDFYSGKSLWLWIAGGMSAISLSLISWMIIIQATLPVVFGTLIPVLLVGSLLRGLFNSDAKMYFDQFGSRTVLFKKLGDLFSLVIKKQFQSPLGIELHGKTDQASLAFIELSRLSNLADQRLNGLVGPIMNGLFLFDVWTILRLEGWRKKYKHQVSTWMEALAQIDMLNSFANFKFNHPDFCEAVIVHDKLHILASKMGHPLLAASESVKNDYEIGLKANAHIITGSNMAGKSTFIRAVGLNVVLALNGLPVCAYRFSCPAMSIACCIRINDSLEEHASYFKAELDRLEQIMKLLRSNTPVLVLLDEILRGTNSEDKRLGTLAFFRKLKDHPCLGLLATHDLVIGQLQEQYPASFGNYCFESTVQGTEIQFDYKLRPGISTSTNATFLMKRLKLID